MRDPAALSHGPEPPGTPGTPGDPNDRPAPESELMDERTANSVVRRIIEARRYAERVAEWAAVEKRRAERREQRLFERFGPRLEWWLRRELAVRRGRLRSVNLPAGVLGYRRRGPKLVVERDEVVIAWAREHLPDAVSTVQRLSRQVLGEHFKQSGELPDDGVHVEPAHDAFFIR